MFEKHGVPVLGGVVATTPEEARAGAEQLSAAARRRRRQGAGQDRRPRQGGRRQARPGPRTRRPRRPREILGMDIKGHTVHRVMIAAGARDRRGVLLLAPARPRRAPLPGDGQRRGRHGDRAARGRASRRPRQGRRSTRAPASTQAKADEIVAAAGLRRRRRAPGRRRSSRQLWTVYRERGRHAGRGQPAGAAPRTARSSRSTARSRSTRTRTSGTRTTPTLEDAAAADPLEARAKEKDLNYVKLDGEVGIIGNGAGLVMSTLDVVAYAGEAHGGVKPANFLDIGGGASRRGHGRGPGHHPRRTRRSRPSSSTSSAASRRATRSPTASSRRSRSSATRRPSRSSCASTATTSLEGRRILAEAAPPARHPRRHDGRRRRQGGRARPRRGLNPT